MAVGLARTSTVMVFLAALAVSWGPAGVSAIARKVPSLSAHPLLGKASAGGSLVERIRGGADGAVDKVILPPVSPDSEYG